MRILRQYPIRDFADVPVGDTVLRVKFKYPTVEQAKRIASTDGAGIAVAICQYCIEDIEGLEDGNGPITVKLVPTRIGEELPEDVLLGLYHAQVTMPLALYYREHVAIGADEKKD